MRTGVGSMDKASSRGPLAALGLEPLMAQTQGRPEVAVGLIDGPVSRAHPDLRDSRIHELPGAAGAARAEVEGPACQHGTFVAGILAARRGSRAPAICPNCTLLVRPLFHDSSRTSSALPIETADGLSVAILECIEAGARIVNLSLAMARLSSGRERALENALGVAARRGVLIVAAAGNEITIGSSAITRHPWTIPVVQSDLEGRPLPRATLARSFVGRGFCAPGDGVRSLRGTRSSIMLPGSSAATALVTGAIALLWSLRPSASSMELKAALSKVHASGRGIVPPLLDAAATAKALHTGARMRIVA